MLLSPPHWLGVNRGIVQIALQTNGNGTGALTSQCYVETKRPPYMGHRMKPNNARIFKGNPSKWPHLRIVWSPQNVYSNLMIPVICWFRLLRKWWMTVLKANKCIRISSFEHWKYFVKPSMASKSSKVLNVRNQSPRWTCGYLLLVTGYPSENRSTHSARFNHQSKDVNIDGHAKEQRYKTELGMPQDPVLVACNPITITQDSKFAGNTPRPTAKW